LNQQASRPKTGGISLATVANGDGKVKRAKMIFLPPAWIEQDIVIVNTPLGEGEYE
jgi:hypothetical protein